MPLRPRRSGSCSDSRSADRAVVVDADRRLRRQVRGQAQRARDIAENPILGRDVLDLVDQRDRIAHVRLTGIS